MGTPRGPACAAGTSCWPEVTFETGDAWFFLDAMCSAECDPGGDGSDCAFCDGVCTDRLRAGSVHLDMGRRGAAGICHVACEPLVDGDGCEGPFQSCDPLTGTCQQACRRSEECRLVSDAGGNVRLDPASTGYCDFATGRCRTRGSATARAGDACVDDAACMDDGVCLSGGAWGPEGYCARFGCEWPALGCGDEEVCYARMGGGPRCLASCMVGAEPDAAQLGVGGHGEGCRPGFACAWDGDAMDRPSGACVPGNYNAITEPNFGAPCMSDIECFSPHGLGRCLGAEPPDRSGICSVRDCFVGWSLITSAPIEGLLPGVETGQPVCPADRGLVCAEHDGSRWCLPRCASADECAPGFACNRPEGACYIECNGDDACRATEMCVAPDGSPCGEATGCRCRGG